MDRGEVLRADHAGHVRPLVGGEDVEVGVALGPDERAQVADPRLVDVVEPLEVLQQLAGRVAVGAAVAADPERAPGLVVVPGDHASATDGAERVAGAEHPGGLRGAALRVEERDRARTLEVALDRAAIVLVALLCRAHLRRDRAAAPAPEPAPPAPRGRAEVDLVGPPVEEVSRRHEALDRRLPVGFRRRWRRYGPGRRGRQAGGRHPAGRRAGRRRGGADGQGCPGRIGSRRCDRGRRWRCRGRGGGRGRASELRRHRTGQGVAQR